MILEMKSRSLEQRLGLGKRSGTDKRVGVKREKKYADLLFI
jgi:hypothetical protein